MDIIFLGTGGSIPTRERNHPAILVIHQGWNFLFDCGEATQIQLSKAGIGLNRRMAIFISHMHADHVLGLPGVLLKFALLGRTRPMNIYGPPELIDYVRVNQATINLGTTFESTVYGIHAGRVLEVENVTIDAFEVDHRGFALGFKIVHQSPTGRFLPERAVELGVPRGPLWKRLSDGESVTLSDGRVIRPEDVTAPRPTGTKIVYSGDSRPCESLRQAARDASLLISEAMFTSENEDLAHERGHMTAAQAAQIARDCNVGHLILTHYSPRYDLVEGRPVLAEASAIFPRTLLAYDLMRVRISERELTLISDNTSTHDSF